MSKAAVVEKADGPLVHDEDSRIEYTAEDDKAIEDYGNRIFRHPGFVRSLTDQEKKLRDLPV